jgi:hypothetical protein
MKFHTQAFPMVSRPWKTRLSNRHRGRIHDTEGLWKSKGRRVLRLHWKRSRKRDVSSLYMERSWLYWQRSSDRLLEAYKKQPHLLHVESFSIRSQLLSLKSG